MSKNIVRLDARETATVLVGLRMFQKEYGHNPHKAQGEWSEHFLEEIPLSHDEINDLCEVIVFGGT